jgi:small-conductance mechanosensitive channel
MKKILYLLIRPHGSAALKWLLILLGCGFIFLAEQGHFADLVQVLNSDSLGFTLGRSEFTIYKILRAIILIIIVFYFVSIISDVGEARIKKLKKIRASNRALLIKAFQILLYFMAFLFSLDLIGLDIMTFTVFSGAVGIGIGFGLQKVTSNFISGLILLFEKSIEQDDLIELNDGTYGFVQHTGARYTLIETFDGKEIMIPNEDFITNRVINWTYSNSNGRVDIELGVSYNSDLELVQKIMLEAAKAHPRCIAEPEPECFLREFGDSSVTFLLMFWVNDVYEGRYQPRSEVMLEIWKKFKEERVEIPFPQRDIHIKRDAKSTMGSGPKQNCKK